MSISSRYFRLAVFLLTVGLVGAFSAGARGALGFEAPEHRLLPLRIHLLRATESPDLDCKLQTADVLRVLGKVNGIWKQAGILFYAESIRSEKAAFQAFYEQLGANRTLEHLQQVRPRHSRDEKMFHAYYIHKMGPNGVILGGKYELIFVKDTARLRAVPGGIDEPLPRVTAHEIGHRLGLPHRQDLVNLMASGTTGIGLNDREIRRARATADGWDWTLSPEKAAARADKLWGAEDGKPSATELYRALALLPGEGEIARRARQRLAKAEVGKS